MKLSAVLAQKSCICRVLQSHPVMLAYLFGSVAIDQTHPFSDVDFALVVDNSVLPQERLHLELAIEDELWEKCSLSEADVRVINDAPLMIRGQIVTEGTLLFARNDQTRIEFETHTRHEYFDFMPTAEIIRHSFFDAIQQRGLHG